MSSASHAAVVIFLAVVLLAMHWRESRNPRPGNSRYSRLLWVGLGLLFASDVLFAVGVGTLAGIGIFAGAILMAIAVLRARSEGIRM